MEPSPAGQGRPSRLLLHGAFLVETRTVRSPGGLPATDQQSVRRATNTLVTKIGNGLGGVCYFGRWATAPLFGVVSFSQTITGRGMRQRGDTLLCHARQPRALADQSLAPPSRPATAPLLRLRSHTRAPPPTNPRSSRQVARWRRSRRRWRTKNTQFRASTVHKNSLARWVSLWPRQRNNPTGLGRAARSLSLTACNTATLLQSKNAANIRRPVVGMHTTLGEGGTLRTSRSGRVLCGGAARDGLLRAQSPRLSPPRLRERHGGGGGWKTESARRWRWWRSQGCVVRPNRAGVRQLHRNTVSETERSSDGFELFRKCFLDKRSKQLGYHPPRGGEGGGGRRGGEGGGGGRVDIGWGWVGCGGEGLITGR